MAEKDKSCNGSKTKTNKQKKHQLSKNKWLSNVIQQPLKIIIFVSRLIYVSTDFWNLIWEERKEGSRWFDCESCLCKILNTEIDYILVSHSHFYSLLATPIGDYFRCTLKYIPLLLQFVHRQYLIKVNVTMISKSQRPKLKPFDIFFSLRNNLLYKLWEPA